MKSVAVLKPALFRAQPDPDRLRRRRRPSRPAFSDADERSDARHLIRHREGRAGVRLPGREQMRSREDFSGIYGSCRLVRIPPGPAFLSLNLNNSIVSSTLRFSDWEQEADLWVNVPRRHDLDTEGYPKVPGVQNASIRGRTGKSRA